MINTPNHAIAACRQTLAEMEKAGDTQQIARALGNLGNAYARQHDWEHAIETYEKALGLMDPLRDRRNIAYLYHNLGNVYGQQGECDRAIACYEQELKLQQQAEEHNTGEVLDHMGHAYQSRGDWQQALLCYQKSIEIRASSDDEPGLARTYMSLGKLYQALGKSDEAAQAVARAYALFSRLEIGADAYRACECLADMLGSVEAAQTFLEQIIPGQAHSHDRVTLATAHPHMDTLSHGAVSNDDCSDE